MRWVLSSPPRTQVPSLLALPLHLDLQYVRLSGNGCSSSCASALKGFADIYVPRREQCTMLTIFRHSLIPGV